MPIAHAVQLSLRRHLWYLTQELVVFGLFDNSIDPAIRSSMAAELLQCVRPGYFTPGKPDFPPMANVSTLAQLIGPRSWLLFHLLNVEGNWLRLAPEQWPTNAEFVTMRQIVSDIAVVNDAAERGVKDVQEYANAAADGAERERIVLVSNSHRAKIPKFLKNEMNEEM